MRAFLCAVLAVTASCAVGPDYERPPVQLPEAWRDGAGKPGTLADLEWWRVFGDPVLTELIESALRDNYDARLAVERIAEVRARLGFVRADLYPRLDAGAAAGVVHDSRRANPLAPLIQDPDYQTWQIFGSLTWELDVFGRIRRATEAEQALVAAAEEDRRAVRVSVIAEVGQAYLDVRDLDARVEIARGTVASRKDYVEMAKARFTGGKTSELDFRQAEAELGRTESVLAQLEQQRGQRENDLSLLLGRSPGTLPRGRKISEIPAPPAIPPGIPSELLERRPDLRSAEQQLVSANARIGEAKALMYPRFALTGQAGYASTALTGFLKSPSGFWDLIGGLTAPIWDWGKNRARVEESEARKRQAVILYERSIRQALKDVDDALIAYRRAVEKVDSGARRVAAQRSVLTLSESRYRGGVSAYLEVLDAQRELLDAELQQAVFLRERLAAVVLLYRALGGGWDAPPTAGAP